MDASQNFYNLLNGLLSNDNDARNNAEKQYQVYCSDDNNQKDVCRWLLPCIEDLSLSLDHRYLAIILCKNRIGIDGDVILHSYRNRFLNCLIKEDASSSNPDNIKIKEALNELILKLMASSNDYINEWPELMQYILNSLQQSSSLSNLYDQICSIKILGAVVEIDLDSLLNKNMYGEDNNDNDNYNNNGNDNNNHNNNFLSQIMNIFSRFLAGGMDADTNTSATTYTNGSISPKLRLAALEGIAPVLIAVSVESQMDRFTPVIQCILMALKIIVQSTVEDNNSKLTVTDTNDNEIYGNDGNNENMQILQDYASIMVTLAENSYALYGNSMMRSTFQVITEILSMRRDAPNHNGDSNGAFFLPEGIWEVFLEILVVMSEELPIRALKLPYPSVLFPMCVKRMTYLPFFDNGEAQVNVSDNIDDNPDEYDDDDEEETFQDSTAGSAEMALYRMCSALGVGHTYEAISNNLSMLLSSNEWPSLYAGMRMIGIYVEISCTLPKDHFLSHRKEVISLLLRYSEDTGRRVRCSALKAWKHVAEAFAAQDGLGLQANEVETLLVVLLASAGPQWVGTVRIAAFEAIEAVLLILLPDQVRGCNGEQPILTVAMTALSIIPKNATLTLTALKVIMALSERSEESRLKDLYEPVIKHFKDLIQATLPSVTDSNARNDINHHFELVRSHLIDTYSCFGERCGKTLFYADALEMMNVLAQLRADVGSEDSDAKMSLLRAWVRIARCIDFEFLPYMSVLMTRLLSVINQFPNHHNHHQQQKQQQGIEQSSQVEKMIDDDIVDPAYSAIAKEQECALKLLIVFLKTLNAHSYPFVEQCTSTIVPLVTDNKAPTSLRSLAMSVLAELVRCTGLATTTKTSTDKDSNMKLGRGVAAAPADKTSLVNLAIFAVATMMKTLNDTTNTTIRKMTTKNVDKALMTMLMTTMGAIRDCIYYACLDWDQFHLHNPNSNLHSKLHETNATGEDGLDRSIFYGIVSSSSPLSVPFLNMSQVEAVLNCSHMLLRQSLQQRTVFEAEKRLEISLTDENRNVDTRNVMEDGHIQENRLQFHFSIVELVASVLRTHCKSAISGTGDTVFKLYQRVWQDTISIISQDESREEDKLIAFLLQSDMIEFALPAQSPDLHGRISDGAIQTEFLDTIIPRLVATISGHNDNQDRIGFDLRQVATRALGKAAERCPRAFSKYATIAADALHGCMQAHQSVLLHIDSTGALVVNEIKKDLHSCVDTAAAALMRLILSQRLQERAIPNEILYIHKIIECAPLYHSYDLDHEAKEKNNLLLLDMLLSDWTTPALSQLSSKGKLKAVDILTSLCHIQSHMDITQEQIDRRVSKFL